MLNILETDFAGPEQNSSLPSCPSCNTVRCSEPSAKPPPLAQLKSRSKEEIDWACDLDSSMTRAQAIARIKERFGIDLRWPTTYARFLQWRHQQRIQNGLAARLDKFRQFDKQCDLPTSLAAIESTAAALFLEQAVLQQDATLFLSLLRLRLRERTLALQEKKLALEKDRLQLEAASQQPPQAVPEPPPVPAPIASPQSTDSLTSSLPIDHSKPPQKHTTAALNPKLKTQVYGEKHNFLHLFSIAELGLNGGEIIPT